MREYSQQKNRRETILKLIILSLTLFVSSLYNASAQSDNLIDDASILHDELTEIRDQYSEIDSRVGEINNAEKSFIGDIAKPQSFFNVSNVGIWLLWIVLILLMIVLYKIRHSVQNIPKISEKLSSSHDDETSQTSLLNKTSFSTTQQKPLVKPVKVVKIKVRKLSKNK